jgi:protein required for attachment to host cells
LFAHDSGDDDFTPIRDFDFPEGRAKGTELVTDRPGSVQSQGTGHGTRRPPTDPKDNAHLHFARELVHHLEAGFGHQQYGQLVLVASLPFLGTLGGVLPTGLAGAVRARIEKDLVDAPVSEIRSRVMPALRKRPAAVTQE